MFLVYRFLASVDKSCTKKAEALFDTTLCCESAEVLTVAGISVLVIRIKKVSVHVMLHLSLFQRVSLTISSLKCSAANFLGEGDGAGRCT